MMSAKRSTAKERGARGAPVNREEAPIGCVGTLRCSAANVKRGLHRLVALLHPVDKAAAAAALATVLALALRLHRDAGRLRSRAAGALHRPRTLRSLSPLHAL